MEISFGTLNPFIGIVGMWIATGALHLLLGAAVFKDASQPEKRAYRP